MRVLPYDYFLGTQNNLPRTIDVDVMKITFLTQVLAMEFLTLVLTIRVSGLVRPQADGVHARVFPACAVRQYHCRRLQILSCEQRHHGWLFLLLWPADGHVWNLHPRLQVITV